MFSIGSGRILDLFSLFSISSGLSCFLLVLVVYWILILSCFLLVLYRFLFKENLFSIGSGHILGRILDSYYFCFLLVLVVYRILILFVFYWF